MRRASLTTTLSLALALSACTSAWDSLRDRSRQCTGTRRDCDNDPNNGCEVETATDRHHCGACDAEAPVACTGGKSLALRSIAGAGATQCVSLTGDGTHSIRCWGLNTRNQVSPSGTDARATPTDPRPDDPSEVHALSVGDGFACAIRGDVRELSCWGSAIAAPMLGPSERLLSLRALAVGARHVCVALPRAATDDNVVRCFGDNDRGQLGAAPTASNIASVQLGDGALFTMQSLSGLAAGASHSCAFDAQSVWCWGANEQGQLGRAPLPGPSGVAAAPVQFASSVRVIDVAAGGESTCAVVSDGAAMSDAGADGSVEASVTSDSACGPSAPGALRATVVCWGAIAGSGRCAPTPAAVRRMDGGTLDDVARVFVGATHACAITHGAEVFCWGTGGESRFTDSAAPGVLVATRIAALSGARELSITGAANVLPITARSAAREGFCALMGSGAMSAVKCWGPNDNDQLGDSARGIGVLSSPSDVRW